MPDLRRRQCKRCNKRDTEVGALSWTGLCTPCGIAVANENLDDLMTHSGPRFHHWRSRIAASVGGVLLDDAAISEQTGRDAA